MTTNMQHSTHAKACDMLCACCLKKVNNLVSESERIPDINHSLPLTTYLCNMAEIRWQVTWGYLLTSIQIGYAHHVG